MDAMEGEITGVRVVLQIVEGRDDGMVEQLRKVEFARGIKRRVHADSNERREESKKSEEDK